MSNEKFHLSSAMGFSEMIVYDDHISVSYPPMVQKKLEKRGINVDDLKEIPYEDIIRVTYEKGSIWKNGTLIVGVAKLMQTIPFEKSPVLVIFYPNHNKQMQEAFEYIDARKGKKQDSIPQPPKQEEPKKESSDSFDEFGSNSSSGDGRFETFTPSSYDSLSDELEKLKRLHDQGAITDEEFKAAKAKLLR